MHPFADGYTWIHFYRIKKNEAYHETNAIHIHKLENKSMDYIFMNVKLV